MPNRRVLTILVLSTFLGVASCRRSAIRVGRTLSRKNAEYKPSGYSPNGKVPAFLQKDSPRWSVSEREHRCLDNNTAFCTRWSTGDSERGRCVCCNQRGFYCPFWICHQKGIGLGISNRDRCTTTSGDTTRCRCFNASSEKDYCEEWYCIEPAVDGGLKYKYYSCQEANKTDGICLRWKEDIRENEDGESFDCHCESKGGGFCKQWNCTERRRDQGAEDEKYGRGMILLIAGGGGILFFGAGHGLAYSKDVLKHWYTKGGLSFAILWFIAVFRFEATHLWPLFVVTWVLFMLIPCLVLKIWSWLPKKNTTNQESLDGEQTFSQNETEMAHANERPRFI